MMKKTIKFVIFWILIFSHSIFTEELRFPQPVGYVNDFAQVLEENYRVDMENLLKNFEKETTVEIAVVTVKSCNKLDPKTYAVKLFESWGIGKKGKDNGVLILLALKERRIEIEVGYGLEGILTDGKCGEILDKYVIPYFKEKRWGEGLYRGVQQIINVINEGKAFEDISEGNKNVLNTIAVLITILVILGIGVFVFLVIYLNKPECPKCSLRKFVKVKNRKIIQPATEYSAGIQEVIYFCKKCGYEWIQEETIPRKSETIGIGGGRFNNTGGGSFGGGRSGGGGAGRSF